MSFSQRHGYGQREPVQPSELIREDAPESVRLGFLSTVEKRLTPQELRALACKVMRVRPDPNYWNWHRRYPSIWEEAQALVHAAPWYQFYDIVEAAVQARTGFERQSVVSALNALFAEENLAWHLADDKVELRTGEASEAVVAHALQGLAEAGRPTAAAELRKAVGALSQRPDPDTRDAVRCALGAMEAVARDITGDRSATLGEILKTHRSSGGLLPPPLMQAFEKAWGYASNVARHVDETKAPTLEEAVLVVGLVAVGVAYLARQ